MNVVEERYSSIPVENKPRPSKKDFHAYTKQRKKFYEKSHRKRTLKKLEAAGFNTG